MKENDLILNMLANPDFTLSDFQAVGLTSENTGLAEETKYLESEKIKSNPYFQDALGLFDEAKFHKFYLGAALFYGQLSQEDYFQTLKDEALFSKDNIWVAPEKRTLDYSPKLVRLPNESLVTTSLESLGKRGQRKYSLSEIAQTLQVYDIETGEWKDSPNESFFDNFFETLVLATYDEDEFDADGNLLHQKGERKLNEEGLPYYETLGGRNVYGKEVLNKFNTITTDGSVANRFDFFDTDSIELKSFVGSLMRNAVLVGSMFIPYVGPVVTALSVGTQALGLIGNLGKLIAGDDSETLNNLVGWSKSVSRQGQTEYASKNTWCVENILNMVGDTIGQLKELRWIFKYVPALLGHSKAVKAMDKYDDAVKLAEKELAKKGALKSTKDLMKSINSPQHLAELKAITQEFAEQNHIKAINYVDDLIAQATKVGSPIGKAYMTGIVILDTYSEARAAGASHEEAVLLTLGYAAGELAILNTPLGEWITPELQGTNFKFNAIKNALTSNLKNSYKQAVTETTKKGFVQKFLKMGKDVFDGTYAQYALAGTKGLARVGANALTEMTEEVSEEFLADFSKTIFNITRSLRGEETLELGAWDNMFDRYAMSALGGFLGGGIASAGTDFKQARDLSSMNRTQALQEVLYMVNNNKEREFIDFLDKSTVGNKHLSANKILNYDSDGNPIYAEGTATDNLDLEIKNIVKKEILLIKDILESEGAKISTQSLLNKLTLEDQKDVIKHTRYANLQNASALDLYLLDFLNIQADIVKTKAAILKLENSKNDSANETELYKALMSELTNVLSELRKRKDSYIKSDLAPEALSVALYEMNPLLSSTFNKTNLKLFAKAKFNKSWDLLSDEEKKQAVKEYKEYKEVGFKNDIKTGATIFKDMTELFTPFAQNAQEFVLGLQKDSKIYDSLTKLLKSFYSSRYEDSMDIDNYLTAILTGLNNMSLAISDNIGHIYTVSPQVQLRIQQIQSDPTIFNKDVIARTLLTEDIALYLEKELANFVSLKYIHPEVKRALINTIDVTTNYLNSIVNDPQIMQTIVLDDLSRDSGERIVSIVNTINNLGNYKNQIEKLDNTPVIQFLNLFLLNTTNSDLNLTKHLQTAIDLVQTATTTLDISQLTTTQDWIEDNQEALLLLDSFTSVLQGMRVDNADLTNPTGYTKILNEIYTKQGVKNYVKLAELDSSVVDMLVLDVNLIREKLLFVEQIHKLNSGLKLAEQNKVTVNKNFLIFKELKTFISVAVPDDWVAKNGQSAKDYLTALINSSDHLKMLSQDNLLLTKEEKKAVEQEMVTIEDALYEIFTENNKGGINIDKIKSIISSYGKVNGFFERTGDILTPYTQSLDKNSFIWLLAARFALKTSDFNQAYVKSLSNEIAPIASQELAIQLGVAAVTNMDVLNAFVEAYRSTVVTDFNKLSPDDRKKLLNLYNPGSQAFADRLLNYFASYNAVPLFNNMVFVEGIPGSGKSGGVFKSIISVLKNIDSSLVDGIIYTHTTKANAQQAVNKTEATNPQIMDKESLMSYISSEWKDVLKNGKNKDGKVYLYEDSFEFVNGKLENKWAVNKVPNPPRVIFIDEISHYNQLELSMIEQFAKEHQIVILTAGDLDQNALTCYFHDNKLNEDLDVSIDRNYFIRSPKLGLTLRTLNKQMTQSITNMLAALQALKQGQNVTLAFTYHESEEHSGLYGVKIKKGLDEETKTTILKMVDTASENIGFLYSNDKSDLYLYIVNTYKDKVITALDAAKHPEYKDKIVIYKDNEAQGLESLYYIVDDKLSLNPTMTEFVRSLYTGISRAEQGVLAIISKDNYKKISAFTSDLDPTFLLEHLPKQAILKESEKRRLELEELISNNPANSIAVIPPSKRINTPPKPSRKKRPEKIGPGYTSKRKALKALDKVVNSILALSNPILRRNSDSKQFSFINGELLYDSNEKTYIPILHLSDSLVITTDDLSDYTLIDNNSVIPKFSTGDIVFLADGRLVSIDSVIIEDDNVKYLVSHSEGSEVVIESDLRTEAPSVIENSVEDKSDVVEKETIEEPATLKEYNEIVEGNEGAIQSLYSLNAFHLGILLSDEGQIVLPDNALFRNDDAIGLIKLRNINLTNVNHKNAYKLLETTIANLRNTAFFTPDKIVEELQKQGLPKAETQLVFAIKSSSKTNVSGYEKFYTPNEIASYVYTKDGQYADNKHLVLLVKLEGKVVFELTLTSLENPTTKLKHIIKNPLVTLEFKRINNIFDSANPKGDLFGAINAVITNVENDSELQRAYKENKSFRDLINLFKFWLFNSNGIFYLGNIEQNVFKPATNIFDKKSAPVFSQNMGENLVNSKLQFKDSLSIYELAQNPALHFSDIMVVKEDIRDVKKGHPFILVSSNPEYRSTEKLVEAYKNNDSSVERFYVIPPESSIKEWLENTLIRYNFNQAIDTTKSPMSIGNIFTAYRVLEALQGMDKFDYWVDLNQPSKDYVKKALSDLQNIENNWKNNNLNNEEKAKLESLKSLFGEERALERCIKDSLAEYLQSSNNTEGIFMPINKTVDLVFTEAILRIFYTKDLTTNLYVLKKGVSINSFTSLLGDSIDIHYQTTRSSTNISTSGDFIKVETVNLYFMETLEGEKPFYINGKIDSPVFTSEYITNFINELVTPPTDYEGWGSQKRNMKYRSRHIHYNTLSKVWKLNNPKYMLDYLGTESLGSSENSVTNLIKKEYSNYSTYLDFSVLKDNLSKENNLIELAKKYNETPGNYGFYDYKSKKLYLFKNDVFNFTGKNSTVSTDFINMDGNIVTVNRDTNNIVTSIDYLKESWQVVGKSSVLLEEDYNNFLSALESFNNSRRLGGILKNLKSIPFASFISGAFGDYSREDVINGLERLIGKDLPEKEIFQKVLNSFADSELDLLVGDDIKVGRDTGGVIQSIEGNVITYKTVNNQIKEATYGTDEILKKITDCNSININTL